MKAAVLREQNTPLEIEEVQVSKPEPREVLVRPVAAGVCHSDLHFLDGSYPYALPTILGHESAGIVEEVGRDVTYVKKGDHVITCLSAFCGHCDKCLTGHLSLCQSPEVSRQADQQSRLYQDDQPIHQFLNLSSFAELMLIHEHALVKIREDMPMDRAALIGCSTTTGVGAVFHTAGVEPGSKVAVIGCGGVGLAAVNGAAVAGAGCPDRHGAGIPSEFILSQNFPNPFNPNTSIGFHLPSSGRAGLTIYDIRGRRVTRLLNGELKKGFHTVNWNGLDERGRAVASGIYFYVLDSKGVIARKKMVLIR